MKSEERRVIVDAFNSVVDTANLEHWLRHKLLDELALLCHTAYEVDDEQDYFDASVSEFLSAMNSILETEGFSTQYRVALTEHFLREFQSWLTGNFDSAAD